MGFLELFYSGLWRAPAAGALHKFLQADAGSGGFINVIFEACEFFVQLKRTMLREIKAGLYFDSNRCVSDTTEQSEV